MELKPGENLSSKAKQDYRLVRLAMSGDQKSYAVLMDRYRDAIYFLLLKMISNRDDAEDLMIEAFGKAFKNLHQYSPNYAFSTWLFKIASNNCIDFIRKRKKRLISIDKTYETEEGGEISMALRSKMLDPEENIVKDQKITLLRDVVKSLKPRYRTLIELRYFREFAYEEIAQHLDIPIGTVKAQLHRAREFLYLILQNMEGKI